MCSPAPTPSERAHLQCQSAKRMEEVGEYDAAREDLNGLWPRVGERPPVEGMERAAAAEVLLRSAREFIAGGRAAEAEGLARSAVQVLERGGEQSLLAEALRTQGVARARLGMREQALEALRRAAEVAEQAGDFEGAGQAVLTLLEELGGQLGLQELLETFGRADALLSKSGRPENRERLLECARRLLFVGGARPGPESWGGFSFEEAVRRFEARLLEWALRDAGGVITQAARLLGIKRQSLSSMLHMRHRELLSLRAPRRRVPAFRGGEDEARAVTILHVEDCSEVSDAVRETLEGEGWRVEVVGSGAEASRRLGGGARYDALIFDYELPGADGVELTRLVRRLPHRRRTPVIMLTASDVEREARRAGVDSFLRKPQDVGRIAETVAPLLARRQKESQERGECEG